MDIDPLADTVPPRHAVESEEEDEGEYDSLPAQSPNVVEVDVKLVGNVGQVKKLIIATGDAGRVWSQGAKLGEQTGRVLLNNIEVGLIFSPSWTNIMVLVSEATVMLPAWAMHVYAETIIDHLQPLSFAFLDTYPVMAYVSSESRLGGPPLRFLTTHKPPMELSAEPFLPPNLLQSTTASFLSILTIRRALVNLDPAIPDFFVILLPSQYSSARLSANLTRPKDLPLIPPEWPRSVIGSVHSCLFRAVEDQIPLKWGDDDRGNINSFKKKRELGESGMYM